jgi:molecular chaperone DnaK (HSP70)
MTVAVGIDFGLEMIRFAALIDDQIELVTTLPSAIGFVDDQPQVGSDLHSCRPDQRHSDLMHWLAQPANDSPAGVAWPVVDGRARSPVELLAWLMRAGISAVESRFGRVLGAVVAVPATLAAVERRVIRDAVIATGVSAVRLIAAPTAVALAIGNGRPMRVMIIDAGADALQVAIVEHVAGMIDVLGHDREPDAGGRAIDRAIANQLGTGGESTALDLAGVARMLKTGAEVLGMSVARPTPEQLAAWSQPALAAIDAACDRALATAHIDPAGLSDVALVGGGAHFQPLVDRVVARFSSIVMPVAHPETTTVVGAARAAQLFVSEPAAVTVDVISHGFSLGAGSALAPMIAAKTLAPMRAVRLIARERPDRTALDLELWEDTRPPRPYGRYHIAGLPAGSGAIAACEVTVDVDQIPRIDASDLVNGGALTVTPVVEVGLGPDELAALRATVCRWNP